MSRRYLVLIKSCWKNTERRQAMRETWLPKLDWADYRFVVGMHAPVRPFADPCENVTGEGDVKAFPVDDGFKNIAPKVKRGMAKWALEYDNIIVCDDDTYAVAERLQRFAYCFAGYDYVGFYRENPSYMQGSLYMVNDWAARKLAMSPVMKDGVPDDVAAGEALSDCRWCRANTFIDPGPVASPILKSNHLVSTHKCLPTDKRNKEQMADGLLDTSMRTVHRNYLDSL